MDALVAVIDAFGVLQYLTCGASSERTYLLRKRRKALASRPRAVSGLNPGSTASKRNRGVSRANASAAAVPGPVPRLRDALLRRLDDGAGALPRAADEAENELDDVRASRGLQKPSMAKARPLVPSLTNLFLRHILPIGN